MIKSFAEQIAENAHNDWVKEHPTVVPRQDPPIVQAKSHKGSDITNHNTPLTPAEQNAFSHWSKQHNIQQNDSIDWNGYFKTTNGANPQDLPQFRKPGHEKFTDDSIYSNKDNPGGHYIKDKTGHDVYIPGDKWHKEQLNKINKKNNPRISDQMSHFSTLEDWVGEKVSKLTHDPKKFFKDIFSTGNVDTKKVHNFINQQEHEKRMAQAEKTVHKDNILSSISRHAEAVQLKAVEALVGMADFAANLTAKATKSKTMQNTHEELEMWKQQLEERSTALTSDPKNQHKYLHTLERSAQDAFKMGTEMFILGGLEGGVDMLSEQAGKLLTKVPGGKGAKMITKGLSKLVEGVAKVENKYKLATNFGYFGTKSGQEYMKTHMDIIENLEKNGIPPDASNEERAYYNHLLENKGDIKKNAWLVGLVNGAAFSTFHGTDVFNKMISPLTEKFGGAAAREYVAKMWAEGSEKSGFKAFMQQRGAEAAQVGMDVAMPAAQGAFTFGSMGVIPSIAEKYLEKKSFDKDWTWKQVGSEALNSALTGFVMSAPHLVAGPAFSYKTIKGWKADELPRTQLNEHFANVDKIKGPESIIRAYQSETELADLTNKLTREQKIEAIKIAKEGKWSKLQNITKGMKPEDAENFKKYVVETRTLDKLYDAKGFDKNLYNNFTGPLKEIASSVGESFNPTTRVADIASDMRNSEHPEVKDTVNKISATIDERQDVKPAVKDAVKSFILQHYNYGHDGLQRMREYMNEHSSQFADILSGETEANQQRGKDFHALLSDIVKGKRSMELYDKQGTHTTQNVYDKVIEAIEKHGGLATESDKKALTLAAVEDLTTQMNNHYKQCIDMTSNAGIQKVIDFFKTHGSEFTDSENAFSFSKLKHFMGEEPYEELLNSLEAKEQGIDIPQEGTIDTKEEELPGAALNPVDQEEDVLPQTSSPEGTPGTPEEEYVPTPDEVAQDVRDGISEEIASVDTPDFAGLSDTAYAEYISGVVREYASDRDAGEFYLKHSSGLERLSYKIANDPDAEMYDAHYENKRLGLEYSIVYDKASGEYEIVSDGETIGKASTFNEVTDTVFEYLEGIQKERGKLKLEGRTRTPREEKVVEVKSEQPIEDFKGTNATVVSRAPKIPQLEREHKRANSPVYANEHFQNGALVLSDNWREVRDMEGNIHGEHYAMMEDYEPILQNIFSLPSNERKVALEELKANKPLWDKLIEIAPLKYACEAGNYFIHDDFMGSAAKDSPIWHSYRDMREKMLENLIGSGGKLGGLKVKRIFGNIDKGEIRSIQGTEMSKVGKVSMKDGQLIIEHNGAKLALANKILGHNYNIDGDDADISQELSNLIANTAYNGGKLTIDPSNCKDYGIKVDAPVDARKIIELFYNSGLDPANGSRGYVHVDYDNKKFYVNNKEEGGLHQISRTLNENDMVKRIAELQSILALRPIDIDPKKLNSTIPFNLEMGDFKVQKGQTLKEALLENGFLLSNNDLDQPYRDTSLQITYEPPEGEVKSIQQTYEEVIAKPGKMSPALTPKETTTDQSYEEKYATKKLEEMKVLDIPSDLVFRESSAYENSRFVRPETPEAREAAIQVYRNMLSEKTGGTLTITKDNRTPFRVALEKSVEGWKPETKNLFDIMEQSGQPHYFHAAMSLDGATLYNRAETSSLYHEAFHRVSLLYLSPEERAHIYEEARGSFPDTKGMDDARIEEFLAEKFRNEVTNSKANLVKPNDNMVMKALRSMWEFVQQYVLNIKPNVSGIEQLMDNIQNGKYKYVRPDSDSIRAFKEAHPDNYVGFESNGTVFPSIPNKQTYDNIVKTMANRILEHAGDISGATNAEEYVTAGLKGTFARDIEEHKNSPTDDSERAIAYREDLMHEDTIGTFAKDIINYIKTKGGLKRYLDSFHSDDDIGATLRYAFDGDKADPYARCNDRLYNLINNLKGDYDPELTMNKYNGSAETRNRLMQRLGGKFTSIEEMKKVLEKEASDPKASLIFKSFYDAVINDPEMLTAAYTMFAVDKINYKDVSIKNGRVDVRDATPSGTKPTLNQWTDKLKDMRNMDKTYINDISQEITQLRDVFTKQFDQATFGDYVKGLVEGTDKLGMDLDQEALTFAAKDLADAQYGNDPDYANLSPEEKEVFYKEALKDALSAGGKSNPFHELQRIWQTAKNGCRDSYSRVYGKGVLIPFDNIIKGDSPSLNVLAEIMSKYGNENASSFVVGPDGQPRYIHRDSSYFGDLFNKYFQDPEYVANLMNNERLSANQTLHSGRFKDLRVGEALAFKGENGTTEYGKISPLESFQMRLQGNGMRQISDKGRMPIIDGVIDNYQGADDLLQSHGLAEYNTRMTAHSVRAGFVRDMLGLEKGIIGGKEIDTFNDKTGKEQLELLKDKKLLDYGMVEGYHYKYVKETDNNGKLTGWKIKLDGGGYHSRFFGHVDEASKFPDKVHLSDTASDMADISRKVVTDTKVLEANKKHLDDYLQMQLDKAYEVGAIKDKVTLKDLDPDNLPQAKIDEWEASFDGMCDRLANTQDDRLLQFKADFNIETADDIKELINTQGADVVIPIGDKHIKLKDLSLEGVGKFFKNYGDSPYAEQERKTAELQQLKDQVFSAMMRDLELNELIEGDPAFSGGYNNQTKRISGMFSTGKKFVSEYPEGHPLAGRTKFKRLNVHDAIVSSEADWLATAEKRAKALERLNPGVKSYDEWLAQAKEETKGIRDVMTSDGQSFISPSMAREMQIRLGLWNEEKQAAYDDLKAFINGSDKAMRGKTLISPIMKCMHWEQKTAEQLMHDGTSKTLTGYEFHKTAYAPLIVYDRTDPMFKVLKHMEDNDIGTLGFGSTTKTFGTDKVMLWDGDGNLMEDNLSQADKYITEHSWDNLRWQLPTDPHGNKPRKFGIQSMKILFDVADAGMKKKMHDTIAAITNIKMKEAFDEETSSIASKIVSRGLNASGIQDNSVEAVMQGVDIAKLKNPQLTKSALQGISKSLDTSTNGGSLVQASNIGGKKLRLTDEKGRAEVAVNMSAIQQYMPKGTSLEEAKMILEKINKDIGGAEMLLYRVPTQGVTSMFHGVVKELLPDSSGDRIHTPDGMYARLGADNDIDKLYYASKTLVARGNENFKPNEELLANFETYLNSSKILDSADEAGVGRVQDRMDFDYVAEAHKFAMDNYAVYDEATDTFLKCKGGKKEFFDNITYEAISNKNEESAAAHGNAYLDAAYSVLRGDGADLPSTSSVDGPVSHAKEVLTRIAPTVEKQHLHQLGVAAQVDNRANNLGGQENIGPYALASSMKGIYDNGQAGSVIPKSERKVGVKFNNISVDIPDFISRSDRNPIFNKQGRPIADDLVAYVSLAVDSSKDPIMLSGNNNSHTNRACALLLLEGHGDAAPALIANPIIRDYVTSMENSKDKNPNNHYLEAINKYSTVGEIMPKTYEDSQLAAKKFNDAYMKKISSLGEKVMDPEWLMKQCEKYKEYKKEGLPIEEWPEDFKNNQIAILAQFINANAKASELGEKLAINQIDKKFGGNYSDFYTMMTKLNKAKMAGREYFNPVAVLSELNTLKGDKTYYVEKAKQAMEAVIKLRDSGMVDFSEPFMFAYDNIVKNHMTSYSDRGKSMENLHSSMMRSAYAMAFEKSGMDIKSLYKGDNTVWDQFVNLKKDGLLDPSNPVVKYLSKSLSMGLEGKKGIKALKLDLKQIESREEQQNIIQGFRDMKTFSNDPRIEKFLNDYITYSYIAGGSHVAPHLLPPEMIDAHEGIQKSLGYLNVIDNYDLVNNALRHASLDKYSAMGDAEFKYSDRLYAKGINMDKDYSDPELGTVAFNLKPSSKKPKNFIVAKMPDGEKRVFRLVYSHEGEIADRGETKYVHTYALAPSIGEKMPEGYVAETVDETNDRKITKAALKRLYGDDIPKYARVNNELMGDGEATYDPFVDKVLWDDKPKSNIDTAVTEDGTDHQESETVDLPKNNEFTTVKDRAVTITEDLPKEEIDGVSVVDRGFIKDAIEYSKSLGTSMEDFKKVVTSKLDGTGEIILPEYVEMDKKHAKALADVLEPYGIDIGYDDEGVAFFQIAKSMKPNVEPYDGLSEQHLGILSNGAKELVGMKWDDYSNVDNDYTKLIGKEDFDRAHKNGLMDIIATFAANDGYSAANVADAMGLDAEKLGKKLVELKNDPVVLKLVNTHYDEPISSKLFNSLPEPAQKSIIESMFYC